MGYYGSIVKGTTELKYSVRRMHRAVWGTGARIVHSGSYRAFCWKLFHQRLAYSKLLLRTYTTKTDRSSTCSWYEIVHQNLITELTGERCATNILHKERTASVCQCTNSRGFRAGSHTVCTESRQYLEKVGFVRTDITADISRHEDIPSSTSNLKPLDMMWPASFLVIKKVRIRIRSSMAGCKSASRTVCARKYV